MFFELRQYRTRPGQREKWVKFMEEEIIPFQVGKGPGRLAKPEPLPLEFGRRVPGSFETGRSYTTT
jgi:hypothetical protein